VYDINNNTYLISFYIKNIGDNKIKDIAVSNNHFYALVGTHIVRYSFSKEFTKHFQNNKN